MARTGRRQHQTAAPPAGGESADAAGPRPAGPVEAAPRERWSRLVQRVLAPNPSPMTLEGTNTFVVGGPRAAGVLLVDPGPDDERHRAAIIQAMGGRPVAVILLTHGHADHAEGAPQLAAETGAPVRAMSRALTSGAYPLGEWEVIAAAGVSLVVVPTPGHVADHCAFWLGRDRAVFTGDHILGRGSTVIEWPDGDLQAYLWSLRRVRELPVDRLYPGHGPPVADARGKVDEYLEHRRAREAQVLAALLAGAGDPSEIVARVYTDTDPALHPAAELSVRAQLAALVAEGRVVASGQTYRLVR